MPQQVAPARRDPVRYVHCEQCNAEYEYRDSEFDQHWHSDWCSTKATLRCSCGHTITLEHDKGPIKPVPMHPSHLPTLPAQGEGATPC